MAVQNQPCILGTAPEPFDGNGDKAIAFWNILDNYFTVKVTTYDTDIKKVSSALTYFKQGTQAGDWASDRIATTLNRCCQINILHYSRADKQKWT